MTSKLGPEVKLCPFGLLGRGRQGKRHYTKTEPVKVRMPEEAQCKFQKESDEQAARKDIGGDVMGEDWRSKLKENE